MFSKDKFLGIKSSWLVCSLNQSSLQAFPCLSTQIAQQILLHYKLIINKEQFTEEEKQALEALLSTFQPPEPLPKSENEQLEEDYEVLIEVKEEQAEHLSEEQVIVEEKADFQPEIVIEIQIDIPEEETKKESPPMEQIVEVPEEEEKEAAEEQAVVL